MTDRQPIERWPHILQAHVAARCTTLQRVHVLRETDSTQNAARRMSAAAGDVVIAWRQTSGRGRLGRSWADTGEHGLAVTMTVPRDAPHRLTIASAVGTALAIERHLGRAVGLKWPNDVIVQSRKLAGILVEQAGEMAYIGVGINVSQTEFDGELADRAISLAQLGASVDRLVVACSLLECVDQWLGRSESELKLSFAERDVLTGSRATFVVNGQLHTGRITQLDPLRGLILDTDGGDLWLEAAHASLVSAEPLRLHNQSIA